MDIDLTSIVDSFTAIADIDFTGIDMLVGKIALYLLVALILGFVFGWRSGAPSAK